MRRFLLLLICIITVAMLATALSSCNQLRLPGKGAGSSKDSQGGDDVQEKTECTITFDSAGGTEVYSQTVKNGQKGRIPDEPTREGYTFDGWYLDGEKWFFSQNPVTKDITLVAKWIGNESTLVFDGNEAQSGEMEEILTHTGDVFTLPQCGFEKEGFNFVGWATSPDGHVVYSNGVEFEMGSESLTLYAVWSAEPYTITYELNGGTNNEYNIYSYSALNLPVTLHKPQKEGYTFMGWYTSSDFSGEAITEVSWLGNVTLYARFMVASQDFEFEVYADYVEILNYTGNDIDVVVPEYYNGLPVSAIRERAFFGNKTIRTLFLPDSMISIGTNAFKECTALTEVVGGGRVNQIGYGAFHGCVSLKSFTLSQRMSEICDSLFEGCTSLESVTILGEITKIGSYAFDSCEQLKAIELPATVKTIGDYAFNNCKSLEVAEIKDGVEKIGSHAFKDCISLSSINVPNSVKMFGIYAFFGCSSAKTVVIGDGVSAIPSRAFDGCSAVESLTLGQKIITIGTYAFHNCDSLTEVTIPDSVSLIDEYAFRGCDLLGAVDFGDSVEKISGYAFRDCVSLKTATFGSKLHTIGNYAFGSCAFEEMSVPSSVSIIGEYAFAYCKSLVSIYIPAGVSEIGNLVLLECTSLEHIVVDTDNAAYKAIDGSLYNKDGTELLVYAIGKKETNFIIPDGVTSINDRAFFGSLYLEYVTISKDVRQIGKKAFAECDSLKGVVFIETSGWRCSSKQNGSNASWLNKKDVADSQKMELYLTESYSNYYWLR